MSTLAAGAEPQPLEAFNKEALIKRNPHADFAAVQASRPDFAPNQVWTWSKTPNPAWEIGDGANPGAEWRGKEMVHIDPNAEGREGSWDFGFVFVVAVLLLFWGLPFSMLCKWKSGSENGIFEELMALSLELHAEYTNWGTPTSWSARLTFTWGAKVTSNYKIMISSTVPRPIALVSTVSKDGISTNLSPFSYFQNVCQDPPLYSLSFVGGGGICDTVQNLLETGECCISIVSDWFIEAANYTSTNTPRGVSEFALAGLHASPALVVKPSYVAEAAFSIECKLYSQQEIFSRRTGQRNAVMVLVEAVQFHVRKEAIDPKLETVKIDMLRPVWRAGGITYGTAFSGFELPRPDAFGGVRLAKKLDERGFVKSKVEGQ
ncbi:flavo protein-like protein oxygenase [Coleophoma crateriformis]|uniref:Flavo protein-like protein oxygenase n=1 Tax=Coleophoma crateriformis TaxID=565419 RepID=A0A3D8S9Z6_9HELO|nr:flavo protein-like protein oxygenase [Coleophoma crateriformis]